MTKGDLLRDLTVSAIVDSAATVLAQRGEAASMEEIAQAAGIGRATLYRYFATRDELLDAMVASSARELATRIKQAELDSVPFQEAVARLARSIIATGSKYVAVNADSARYASAHPGFEDGVIVPVRALFCRGATEGHLREDLDVALLMDLFSGLMRGALQSAASAGRGTEETAAAVTSVFLHGAIRQ